MFRSAFTSGSAPETFVVFRCSTVPSPVTRYCVACESVTATACKHNERSKFLESAGIHSCINLTYYTMSFQTANIDLSFSFTKPNAVNKYKTILFFQNYRWPHWSEVLVKSKSGMCRPIRHAFEPWIYRLLLISPVLSFNVSLFAQLSDSVRSAKSAV